MADSARPKRAAAFRGSLKGQTDNGNDECATSEEETAFQPSGKKSKKEVASTHNGKVYGKTTAETQEGGLRSMFAQQKSQGVQDVDVHAESKMSSAVATTKRSNKATSGKETTAARSSARQQATAASYRLVITPRFALSMRFVSS
jgi:tyrosyl-tRNA synthetase